MESLVINVRPKRILDVARQGFHEIYESETYTFCLNEAGDVCLKTQTCSQALATIKHENADVWTIEPHHSDLLTCDNEVLDTCQLLVDGMRIQVQGQHFVWLYAPPFVYDPSENIEELLSGLHEGPCDSSQLNELFSYAAGQRFSGRIQAFSDKINDPPLWRMWWEDGQPRACERGDKHGKAAFVIIASVDINWVQYERGIEKPAELAAINMPLSMLLRDMLNMQRKFSLSTNDAGESTGGHNGTPVVIEDSDAEFYLKDRMPGAHVVCSLGRGHFGSVFRVRPASGPDVAVKILHVRDNERDEMAQLRFEREVALTKSIQHENVVSVLENGLLEGGQPYCVMELLEGGSLTDQLVHGALEWENVVHLASSIINGLNAIHDAGIIHRDLKPENILIAANGRVCISDLGMSQQIDERSRDRITKTGVAIGTPVYISPEAVQDSHRTTSASDIYSFGVMLYELLSNNFPTMGNTPMEIMHKHVKGDLVPLSHYCHNLPSKLEKLVMRCLSVKPEDRPSCHQILQTLRQLTNSISSSARRKTNPKLVKMNKNIHKAHKNSRQDNKNTWIILVLILLSAALIAVIVLISQS